MKSLIFVAFLFLFVFGCGPERSRLVMYDRYQAPDYYEPFYFTMHLPRIEPMILTEANKVP